MNASVENMFIYKQPKKKKKAQNQIAKNQQGRVAHKVWNVLTRKGRGSLNGLY